MILSIGIILLVLVVIAVVIVISSKNNIKKSSNQVEEAYSTMDVYLKQRHDLIPNLVNTVKAYADHEEEVLKQLSLATTEAARAKDMNQVISGENKLDNATNRLLAVVQSYPDLKSNQNFNNLMNQLQQVEKDITQARKYYNASVREYNNKITTFPGSMVAGNEEKKPYFQVSSEAERQNVTVNF